MFYPCRYNSSRAKCIRCSYCKLFFSPNKFIFHSHQTATSVRYSPAAANASSNINLNSWRKHIFLINPKNDEQLSSAWEDVKSIFNSGKRKRSSASLSFHSRSRFAEQSPPRVNEIESKRAFACVRQQATEDEKEHIKRGEVATNVGTEQERVVDGGVEQNLSLSSTLCTSAAALPPPNLFLMNFMNLFNTFYSHDHLNSSPMMEFWRHQFQQQQHQLQNNRIENLVKIENFDYLNSQYDQRVQHVASINTLPSTSSSSSSAGASGPVNSVDNMSSESKKKTCVKFSIDSLIEPR